MPYRAVLFDLDGTLLDTLADIADATNAALRAMGFAEHPRADYKTFVGDGVETLIRRVVPADCTQSSQLNHLAGLMRGEYGRRWAEQTRLYDGVSSLLDALAERGFLMAVLSNKPHEFTKLCVERFLSDWSFAAVLGEQPGLPKKPDPSLAFRIAKMLGVPPAEFAYLGDTNTDMQTAVAAGMYPVGALWGFRGADELLAAGARRLIGKPGDLLAVLID